MNRASLTGNAGGDPDIRSTPRGDRVATFSLATTERWKDKTTGEKREATEWHRIVIWNDGLVGIAERYIRKGSKLLVEGQIRTRKYTDKSGVERMTTEIVLQGLDSRIELMSESGGTRPPAPDSPPDDRPQPNRAQDLDDDIPF